MQASGAGCVSFAPEPSAHASAVDNDILGRDCEAASDEALHLARMLGRAVHQQRAIFARQRDSDLALEIEVLLTTD